MQTEEDIIQAYNRSKVKHGDKIRQRNPIHTLAVSSISKVPTTKYTVNLYVIVSLVQ
jgi:hypothetical protein